MLAAVHRAWVVFAARSASERSERLQHDMRSAHPGAPKAPMGLPTFDAYERCFHSAEILKQVQDDALGG